MDEDTPDDDDDTLDDEEDTPETDSEPAPRSSRPGRRTKSNKELEERIELTAMMLARAMPKSVVKRELKAKYEISVRTCEDYISRARELLVKWSGQTDQEHFVEASAFWQSIVQSPSATLRDRMSARQQLDHLYGLARQPKLNLGGDKKDGVGGVVAFVRFGQVAPAIPEGTSNDSTGSGSSEAGPAADGADA